MFTESKLKEKIGETKENLEKLETKKFMLIQALEDCEEEIINKRNDLAKYKEMLKNNEFELDGQLCMLTDLYA